jgi:competence protein ComEC
VVHSREPLIVPCLALASGILAAHYARFDTSELALGLALFAAAGVFARLTVRRCGWLAWTGCIFIAGAALAEYQRPGPPPVMDADSGEVLLVSGCVVEPLSIRDDRGRFTLEVESGARAAASFTIRPGEPLPSLPYGSLVEFPARVRKPRNFGNPGAFDYVRYLARRQVYWLASVQPRATIERLPGNCGSPWQKQLSDFRQAALARLDALHPDDPESGGFLRALLLGDDDQLSQTTSDEFRRTGTYHAIVISGLHISLIAGSLLWLLRQAFAPNWLRFVMAGAVAWIYTLIAGGDAPVMRAAIGFTLALLAHAAYRRIRVLNILAAVAIVFLIADTGQLFEASFQLSFAAVAAIGAIALPVMAGTSGVLRDAARRLDDARPRSATELRVASLRVELRLLAQTVMAVIRVPQTWALAIIAGVAGAIATVWEMVVLSASVQITLLIPSLVYFHRVPFTSLFANIAAVPLLNGAVGFGLTGLLAGSASLSAVAAWLVRAAEAVVAACARLEPEWRSPTPPFWLCLLFTALLILTAVMLRRRLVAALLPGLLCLSVAGWLILYDGGPGKTGWLEVASIDVGQGDSLLVVFPDGETMLVDGGGFPSFRGSSVRRMDVGEQIVSPYLWDRGIRRVDTMVLTHAHDDHAQGLSALLRNFRPRELWTGAMPETAGRDLLAQAQAREVTVRQPRAGERIRIGEATVRVLSPTAGYVPGNRVSNNDSLVLEITYGRRKFLLTGDAERAVEIDLALNGIASKVDVLKVGHHGSKSSTTPDLLATIRPAFAVVSVGEGNLYGHPHPDVVTRLKEARVQSFRTDRAGLTRFRTDGKSLIVETNWPNWRDD